MQHNWADQQLTLPFSRFELFLLGDGEKKITMVPETRKSSLYPIPPLFLATHLPLLSFHPPSPLPTT